MARFDELLNSLREAATAFEKVFEDDLQVRILDFGERVAENPTRSNVAHWLEVYSLVSIFSLDGVPDITEKLYASHPDTFREAVKTLSGEAKQDALDFIDAFDAPDLDMTALENATAAAFARDPSAEYPHLATFSATDAIDTGRVKLYKGMLTVNGRGGRVIGTYAATTGGFIADYRRKNGPTPPGYFFVDNYRSDRGNTPGMKRHGVSYSFDLNELHRTGTRGAFRIHPDGAPPGTHGCVGIAEDREKLLECAHKLDELRQQGRFRLAIKYGARPVPGLPDDMPVG
jgi:hypothetical protein